MNNHEEMHCHSCAHDEKGFNTQLITVILSAILTLPLLFQMFAEFMELSWQIPLWIQFALATIVQFVFGWRFYVGSYYALKSLTGNMDLLVCLGTTAAYVFSAVVFLFSLPYHTYFESSATIITLILLGRLLEMRTMQKSSKALQELLKLQPKTANVQKNGKWESIPIDQMNIGDIFQVKPGEQIPVDGIVIESSSYVDESMLTGESMPLFKSAGMVLFGGTQNLEGALIGKTTAVGKKTALEGIIRLVEQAQNSKAPIQKKADQLSAIFVPLVLFISLVTFFAWWGWSKDLSEALINAVAVLVIACPCALGMATPTVIMVASGRGAKAGILIKNAEAIEKAEKLQVIAIDKTGTLTQGKPKLTDVIPNTEDVRQLAAALEESSEHPVAKAISSSYQGKKEIVSHFEAIPGKGISGIIKDQQYFVGSIKWMEEKGFKIERYITDPLEDEGKTVVALSTDSKVIGYLAVADTLRPYSKQGVDLLKELGVNVVMLTGDHTQTAKAIAQETGISTFFAEILPQDKAKAVEQLKKQNKVGMVGDGINDAPALAAADVGFAMRSGTDVAIESSDITLMRSDLRQVADAIDLSKATLRKIRQNLFFAFIYNALGIPLAAFGLLNPIIAGGAMALSSLCVLANALLLNRWKPGVRDVTQKSLL